MKVSQKTVNEFVACTSSEPLGHVRKLKHVAVFKSVKHSRGLSIASTNDSSQKINWD